MAKRKASFTPTRNVHTLKSVREAAAILTEPGKKEVQIDSVRIERDSTVISNVSLGNVEVRCFHNGTFFLQGRFNTVIRSIVDALNS